LEGDAGRRFLCVFVSEASGVISEGSGEECAGVSEVAGSGVAWVECRGEGEMDSAGEGRIRRIRRIRGQGKWIEGKEVQVSE
jgi:hypothetical protein